MEASSTIVTPMISGNNRYSWNQHRTGEVTWMAEEPLEEQTRTGTLWHSSSDSSSSSDNTSPSLQPVWSIPDKLVYNFLTEQDVKSIGINLQQLRKVPFAPNCCWGIAPWQTWNVGQRNKGFNLIVSLNQLSICNICLQSISFQMSKQII